MILAPPHRQNLISASKPRLISRAVTSICTAFTLDGPPADLTAAIIDRSAVEIAGVQTMPLTTELRKRAFLALYEAGWCDHPISLVLYSNVSTVRGWRESQHLPRNKRGHAKIDDTEARRMYDAGANDYEIAAKFDAHQTAVLKWRNRNDLPSKRPRRQFTPEEIRKAKKMLKLGASRRQVADEIGCTNLNAIQRLRGKIDHSGLRKVGVTNTSIRSSVLKDRGIQRRIEKAIGENVPLDVRLDAVSDMYLDVLDGRLSADFIERQAPSYRSRAYSMCGSKFGARSLDEEIGEGWTIGDTIADPSALDELESAADRILSNDNW